MLVGGVLCAVYLALRALGRRWELAETLGKVFAAGIAAVVFPIVLFTIVNTALDFVPSYVFRGAFGFAPPSDISELEGSRSSLGDADITSLTFRAERTTVDRIIGTRFVELSEDESVGIRLYASDDDPSNRAFYAAPAARVYRAPDGGTLIYDEPSGFVAFRRFALQ